MKHTEITGLPRADFPPPPVRSPRRRRRRRAGSTIHRDGRLRLRLGRETALWCTPPDPRVSASAALEGLPSPSGLPSYLAPQPRPAGAASPRLAARPVGAVPGGGRRAGPEMRATLDKAVASHKVVLFMKGTKDFPQCGFSHTVVQILRSLDVPFETLDVLANEALRQGLKEYSSWPTFPQLYIDGEFFGGCDITV
ncbi:hypothetical protein GUJ93_ZPchr0715g29019, partial [Zizania palustris]